MKTFRKSIYRPSIFPKVWKTFFNLSKSAPDTDVNLLKSVYAAASQRFVKSTGERTLKPIVSLDDKDNIKPFQLVVKVTKRKFIFYEKAFYYPSEFQLTDIMKDQTPLHSKLSTSLLISEYNRAAKISLKGKIGADISKNILALELGTKDSVMVNIEFDKVNKVEPHEPLLMKELSTRCIDLNHPYVKQIRQDPSKVLCLISGVAILEEGGAIQRHTEVGGTATMKASLIKKASVSGGATYTGNRDVGLAPGTPIAYSVHELAVDANVGTMHLVLAIGSQGGFVEGLDATNSQTSDVKTGQLKNSEKPDLDVRHPSVVFKPLLEIDSTARSNITNDLLFLMSVPRDLVILDTLFDQAEAGTKTIIPLQDLEKQLLAPIERWLAILEFAGCFKEGDRVTFPESTNKYLMCIGEFLDAVTSLDDEDMELLRLCSKDNAQRLCTVIEAAMRGKQVTEGTVTEPLVQDEVASQILQGLDFKLTGSNLEPPNCLPFSIDETFWVLFALWGNQ